MTLICDARRASWTCARCQMTRSTTFSTGCATARSTTRCILIGRERRMISNPTNCRHTSWTSRPSSSPCPSGRIPAVSADNVPVQRAPPRRQRKAGACGVSGSVRRRPFAVLCGAAHCGLRRQGAHLRLQCRLRKSRFKELAQRFPEFAHGLEAIAERVVDLLPIARKRYYHPSQQGSWSIKAVLLAMVPELSYQTLEGVQSGGDAQEAFLEAIDSETSLERKALLQKQLLDYCGLDIYAMVQLWQIFSGFDDMALSVTCIE